MAYSGIGITVFQWTNPYVRYPSQWIITPYFNNSAITADVVIAHSEDAMQTAFGALQEVGKTTKKYDQIVVVRYDDVVPSSGTSGVSGDMIGTVP